MILLGCIAWCIFGFFLIAIFIKQIEGEVCVKDISMCLKFCWLGLTMLILIAIKVLIDIYGYFETPLKKRIPYLDEFWRELNKNKRLF